MENYHILLLHMGLGGGMGPSDINAVLEWRWQFVKVPNIKQDKQRKDTNALQIDLLLILSGVEVRTASRPRSDL